MLGGLQFGAMGRLEHQPEAGRNGEIFWSVPAGIVELQHDALGGTRANRFGEVGKHEFEHLLGDGFGDVPHRPAGCGLNETRHVEPLETVMAKRDRTLADGRPDAPGDRLQADPMFIHRPQFDARPRMLKLLFSRRILEVFLSAARSSSVAACGCRGLGFWTE